MVFSIANKSGNENRTSFSRLAYCLKITKGNVTIRPRIPPSLPFFPFPSLRWTDTTGVAESVHLKDMSASV